MIHDQSSNTNQKHALEVGDVGIYRPTKEQWIEMEKTETEETVQARRQNPWGIVTAVFEGNFWPWHDRASIEFKHLFGDYLQIEQSAVSPRPLLSAQWHDELTKGWIDPDMFQKIGSGNNIPINPQQHLIEDDGSEVIVDGALRGFRKGDSVFVMDLKYAYLLISLDTSKWRKLDLMRQVEVCLCCVVRP